MSRAKVTRPSTKPTASVRFSGKNAQERQAKVVFDHCLTLRDPDDPDEPSKHMIPQQILIEALLALGEKLERDGQGFLVSTRDNELRDLKQMLTSVSAKLDTLSAQGVTPGNQQASEAPDTTPSEPEISPQFAANSRQNLKPGRIHRS